MGRQRLPEHVGFIPDGNRRWAVAHGYTHGVAPGIALFEECRRRGIPEMPIYGFTQVNTRRAAAQKAGFWPGSPSSTGRWVVERFMP